MGEVVTGAERRDSSKILPNGTEMMILQRSFCQRGRTRRRLDGKLRFIGTTRKKVASGDGRPDFNSNF
jgi:hypothetical protein